MMSLDEIGLRNGTDKASDGHDYLRVYEQVIPSDTPVKLLEIGWYKGASMRTWREWLNPESIVVGVDINQPPEPVDRVHFRRADATTDDIGRVAVEFGPFDVIVDDGSHLSSHVIASFNRLWPHLIPGGLYIVEDLHVSYHPDWHGHDHPWKPGPGGQTSMQFLKGLADDVHYGHAGAGPAARRVLTGRVESIAFHPGVAILRKAVA
jgi:cephalosporin hydroxylase